MSLSASLTVDLGAVATNWRALDGISGPGVETAAVVKADAYGCGVAPVAQTLHQVGARTFFVAQAGEGADLRAALGPGPVIYVLGGFMPADTSLFPTHDLRPVLNTPRQIAEWYAGPATQCGVQLDSGMNRLGLEEAEIPALPNDGSITLLMSHLACADEPESPLNRAQLLEFTRLAERIAPPGAVLSLSATGGILLGPEYHFGLTRPGIGLYGGLPFDEAEPVVHVDAPVIQVRDVAAGEVVGYGASWTARRPSRIATLSAGYADGIIRAMSNRARAWHQGRSLAFAGRVSMDLITVDVTDTPDIAEGDMVELLGPHQGVDDLAEAAGTIGYEILTSLGSRYQRRYRSASNEQTSGEQQWPS